MGMDNTREFLTIILLHFVTRHAYVPTYDEQGDTIEKIH